MTVVPWVDGNVLTAGSLRLIPQFYSSQNFNVNKGSGTNYGALGSIFVSGGLFGESLLVHFSASYVDQNSAFTTNAAVRIFTSGVGLGGGSEIYNYSFVQGNLAGGDGVSPFVRIPANAGWLPGSDCFVYLQGRSATDAGDASLQGRSLALWGTGKP